MKPHKHCELIKAWADGAEIQRRKYASNEWVDTDPDWRVGTEYRIKPRTVTKEGWVNVYRHSHDEEIPALCCLHPTEDEAKKNARDDVIATVKVEWTEEVK